MCGTVPGNLCSYTPVDSAAAAAALVSADALMSQQSAANFSSVKPVAALLQNVSDRTLRAWRSLAMRAFRRFALSVPISALGIFASCLSASPRGPCASLELSVGWLPMRRSTRSHQDSCSRYSLSADAGESGLAAVAQSMGLLCSSAFEGSSAIVRSRPSRCRNACFLPSCHESIASLRERFSRRRSSTSAVRRS